ncbi:hypothetical protein, partial [Lutibacter sp.]
MKHNYKKHYLFAFFVLVLMVSVSAQRSSDGLWQKTTDISRSEVRGPFTEKKPSNYLVYTLNLDGLKKVLKTAP